MRKRVKIWHVAALIGTTLLGWGCGWYGLALDNVPRVITAILNEDLFG